MTRESALRDLTKPELDTRLKAARTLAGSARPEDAAALQQALAKEKVAWVRTALRQAILRVSAGEKASGMSDHEFGQLVSEEAFDHIRTVAVSAVTKQIVHEISPVLGLIRLHAKDEIEGYEGSQTRTHVDRLGDWLQALDRLSRAAVPPVFEELDLSATIRGIVEAETTGHSAKVELAGPSPQLIVGDPALIELALANGLRNAIEAVEASHSASDELPPIVINWGDTDQEVWVAVLDKGPGPPLAVDRAFDIGSTNKPDHLGMGLATARQAVESLSGVATLALRSEEGGARFELRWPRPATAE